MEVRYCCSYCSQLFKTEDFCKAHEETVHRHRSEWLDKNEYQKCKVCSRCLHLDVDANNCIFCRLMQAEGVADPKVRPDYFCKLYEPKVPNDK